MQLRRKMIEQKRQRCMNGRGDDLVVVIKNKHNVVLKIGEIVDEGCQDILNGRRLARVCGFQHFLRIPERAWTERIQRYQNARPEAVQIVIVTIQREPGSENLS